MAGDALTLPCPQGALTSIGHVKALVHSQRPNWLVASQRLMLPPGDPAASAVAVDIEQNYMPLDDHCTLQQCGIVDGASLELLMIDTEWSESDLALQASMTSGATELDFSCRFLELNHQGAASIAWSLQYEVCRDIRSTPSCAFWFLQRLLTFFEPQLFDSNYLTRPFP